MAGSKQGGVAIGGYAVDQGLAFGGHLQLVGNRGDREVGGRHLFARVDSRLHLVGNAGDGREGLAVEPALAHDSVFVRRGAAHQGSHGRRPVGQGKGIFGLMIDATLALQLAEPVFAVEGREGLKVVGAQLVDNHLHHQAGHLGRRLCLGGSQGHQEGQGG